jgi:steroid 5-alpha reductase family enzyme
MTQIDIMGLIIGYSALILLLYLIIAFIVGTIKKNNGLMDVFYGPGYFVVALSSLILNIVLNNEVNIRQIIVTILVFIWATRLATYVFIRNRGKPEDYRYQAMRKRWGNKVVLKSFYRIYIFQGIVIFIVCFPVWFINISNNPTIESVLDFFGITLWLGAAIWLIGFLFETIGDWTLYRFLQKPENKGEVMDKGVWKLSQHPNYFGEVTQWWGIYVIAIATPFGFITILGPIFITYMILKVSGIKLLDKRFEKDDKYGAYKQRTSVFFPWFPKKNK